MTDSLSHSSAVSGLLPCPFCGGGDKFVGLGATQDDDDIRHWSVVCGKCGSSCSIYCLSEQDAIKAWNTRIAAPAQAVTHGADIVERLRADTRSAAHCALSEEAADEIERLRASDEALTRASYIIEKCVKHELDQRDNAEQCLSQMYYLVTGNSPQWSDSFGLPEALEDVSDALTLLRKSVGATSEACAKIAEPWPGYWLDKNSSEADRAVVAVRTEIAAKIRSLASHPNSSAESVDLTNHHNALKCPYCNPKGLAFAEPSAVTATEPDYNALANSDDPILRPLAITVMSEQTGDRRRMSEAASAIKEILRLRAAPPQGVQAPDAKAINEAFNHWSWMKEGSPIGTLGVGTAARQAFKGGVEWALALTRPQRESGK